MDLRDLSLPSPVAVTGASGYIASWIVKFLLEAGVEVHGTVRDKARADKVKHLTDLMEGSRARAGELKLFEAELLEPGSFDAAIEGCAAVIHTASPFFIAGIKDAQAQLIDPALEGTRNVLEACDRVETVTKVVLTSSAAAMYGDNIDAAQAPNHTLDESVWNHTSSVEINPYSYSKTVAEREAWKIAEAQSRWTLAVINPTFVLGPSLSERSDSTSVGVIRQMTDGTFRFGAPDLCMGVVDVRDVAMAHVLAAADDDARGRHVLAARSMTFVELGKTLRETVGDKYPFPKGKIPTPLLYLIGPTQGLDWRYLRSNIGHPIAFDTTRSREQLGLTYRPVSDSLRDMIEQLERTGLAGG